MKENIPFEETMNEEEARMKKRYYVRKKFVVYLWIAGFILVPRSIPYAAEAEEKKEEEGVPVLQAVVVTATRQEEEVRKIPANVTVINQEDIETSNAKTVLDLLRSEEGIVVRDLLGNGKSAQVDMRGFGETGPFNTLVLVDGRRVNSVDLSGVDWTQIPLDQVQRIEIVRGTGSVLYGDNAVGGVINIVMKPPAKQWMTTVGGLAGSYERIKGKAFVSGGHRNITGSLSVSYEETDGYRRNNEFRARDVGGKIVFDPTEYLSFALSGSYHRDDFGLPGPLTETQLAIDRRATTRPFDEGEATDQYLKLSGDWDIGGYGRITADVSYRDRESEDEFLSSSSATDSNLETWGFTPRYSWSGTFFDHANTFIAGVDIYGSDLDGDSFFGVPLVPSGSAEVGRDTYGFYFNNDFSILENLILSLGARHERVEYDLEQQDYLFGFAPLDDTVTDWENAYSAGLVLLYHERSSLFVRANRSFRFPLTDELVLFDFSTGSIRVNPDIKPQRGCHYEVGIRHFYSPDIDTLRFLGADVEAKATLFRAEIRDEIFFNPLTFTNENHPETLHQGVEIGLKGDFFKRLTIYGNYTFEKAKFQDQPFQYNEIPAVPEHRVNAGFQIYDIIPGLIFSATYNFVGSSFLISDQANRFRKLDQYYTIDARLSYAWKWIKGFIGVNNITNEEYSEYAVIGGFPAVRNFYPAPERNWVAGLEATF
jgi:iron complex outermembrane receptor protein